MLRRLTQLSAWSIYLFIAALYGFSLWAIIGYQTEQTFWSWSQIWKIVQYSSIQAFISAFLSTLFGLLTARCFFYLSFRGKILLYRLFSFAWALPSLVVIFALIGVWGNAGWFATILRQLGINIDFSFYGLQGIVIAHLFLNTPLVMKYCLEGLQLIPSNKHRLATQLGLRGIRYIKLVELPILKGILPYAFSSVFLLCFTSFPIVLMLGGSPKYSTLEVAIYQAVAFEFDFAKAVMLILVQLLFGIILQLSMDFTTRRVFERTTSIKSVTKNIWRAAPSGFSLQLSLCWLIVMSLLFLLPMLNVMSHGLSALSWQRLLAAELWQSFSYSLYLSVISALFALLFAYIIALESRQLAYHKHKLAHSILSGVTTYPLILPLFLLAVGLFLLLMDVELKTWQLLWLLGLCNGLTLLPFVYRLLFSAMWTSLIAPDKLARSLGLIGLRRWWIVEKYALFRPLAHAFALSMSASLGSFSIIAFFGSPDFSTLPYLLYQQLSSYRTEEAAVTALLLMLCALLPFLTITQNELQ